MGLVRSIAARFAGRIADRGLEFEDLIQIGCVGMVKAIRSWDESYGTVFSTYAVPLIIGEIKRFLRDDGPIKVSRSTKRRNAEILKKREEFTREAGREPSVDELAALCGLSCEDLVFALEAGAPIHSLSAPVGDDDAELEDLLEAGPSDIDALTDRLALRQAIAHLPPSQRKIITLRYFCDLSQQQTADRLGLSQVKISREEKKIFEKLRAMLGG